MRLIRHLLPLLVTVLALSSALAQAQVRTFEHPRLQGVAVNYCGALSTSCGEQMATYWCLSQGYEYASEWSAAPALDATATTVRLDDSALCHGTQCDAFATIVCGKEAQTFVMPRLGAAARATVIAPTLRGTQIAVDAVEYQVLIPGCHQREPGVFLCESVHEYQHCRTLLKSGKVFSCRAGLAFDGGFAEPVAVEPGDYELELKSSAEIRVERGRRGEGRVRGEARVELSFTAPSEEQGFWCLQRDRYVYFPTGPEGGLSEIDDTAGCSAPIEVKFAPHEDHVLQAYDLCSSFSAWGSSMEQPMDIIVSALFHVSSLSSQSRGSFGSKSTIIAPYLTVKAPVQIDCRD